MKGKRSGTLILSMLALFLLMAVAGPSGFGAKKTESGKPVELDWLAYQTIAQPDPNSYIIKEVEKRFNVKFNFWFVDDQRWNDVLNVKFAAGEVPDVFRIKDLSDLPQYVKGGIVSELPTATIKKLAPHYFSYISKVDKQKIIWDVTKYQGKNYGFSSPNMDLVYPYVMVWRTDWLKNVGITKKPKTLAEFETAMYKFRNNDPDKNGKKDTYGLSVTGFNAVFGAFGVRDIPLRQTDPAKLLFMYDKSHKIVFTPLQPGAKKALALLQKWYKDGIIDPEFVTGENKGGYWALSHSFMENRIGLTSEILFYHYQPADPAAGRLTGGRCYREMLKLNPKAEFEPGNPPIGPNGQHGLRQDNYSGEAFGVSVKAVKNHDKIDRIMQILDTMFYDINYYKLVNWGKEGFDWRMEDNKLVPIPHDDLPHPRVRGINVVSFLNGNALADCKLSPYKYKYANQYAKYSGYIEPVIPATQAGDRYLESLRTMTQEAFIKIISGEKSLDYYDEYVKKFRANGGDQVLNEVNEAAKK